MVTLTFGARLGSTSLVSTLPAGLTSDAASSVHRGEGKTSAAAAANYKKQRREH